MVRDLDREDEVAAIHAEQALIVSLRAHPGYVWLRNQLDSLIDQAADRATRDVLTIPEYAEYVGKIAGFRKASGLVERRENELSQRLNSMGVKR